MIPKLIEKFKNLYQKPFVQMAIQSAVVGLTEQVIRPWGFAIVKTSSVEKQEQETEITED